MKVPTLKWKFIFFIFVNCYTLTALYSQTLSYSRNSRTFESQSSSLVTKGLAYSCLSLTYLPDSLPCNPASLALKHRPNIGLNFMLSNGYETLTTAKSLLGGEAHTTSLDQLFENHQTLQLDISSELRWSQNTLALKVIPESIKFFSVVRNEANPDIELYAIRESSLVLQKGFSLYSHLYGGLQLRAVKRKIIREQLLLVELSTEAGKNKLLPKEETGLFIEPGLLWAPPLKWDPRLSLYLANAPLKKSTSSQLPTPTEVQMGVALSPPLPWGELELNLDFKSMNYQESFKEKLHLGALYTFGVMSLFSGIDDNGLSGGLYYNIRSFNAGIVYSTTKLPNQNKDFYTQTIYTQIGWQN